MLLACAGCFSLATAAPDSFAAPRRANGFRTPREHVVVSNYGWYLFNWIPLACGNARTGARFPFVLFRDDVKESIVHDKITSSYAVARGLDLEELNLIFTENVLLTLPGTSVPIPLPYVVCYRERLVSGVLVERRPPKMRPSEVRAPQTPAAPAVRPPPTRDMQRLLDRIPDGGVR